MKKNLWELIWYGFLETKGFVLVIMAIVLPIILWIISPNTTIWIGWFIFFILVCIIIISTFVYAFNKAYSMCQYILPKMLNGKRFPSSENKLDLLCLLESSELFSHGMLVSFYYIDEALYEQLIGIGYVINVQDDGRIQVRMKYPIKAQSKKIKSLMKNNAITLEKIRVKPTIPQDYLYLNNKEI